MLLHPTATEEGASLARGEEDVGRELRAKGVGGKCDSRLASGLSRLPGLGASASTPHPQPSLATLPDCSRPDKSPPRTCRCQDNVLHPESLRGPWKPCVWLLRWTPQITILSYYTSLSSESCVSLLSLCSCQGKTWYHGHPLLEVLHWYCLGWKSRARPQPPANPGG